MGSLLPKVWRRLLLVSSAVPLLFGGLYIAPAFAQDDDEDGEMLEVEEIVVTGSRIRRDTFSTTTPIQILNTEDAARIGITSITEMMQKSTAVSGQKVDASINTNAGNTNASEAPAEGGVGSSCVNLRGLGCERTLVLINGKRLGLAGIRGAPPQPDINVLPIGMVEAVDVLTGGLSTVYGADAVAGVVNVRLKRDFEGFQFTGTAEPTDHKGGEIYQGGFVAGVTGDLGNITVGFEYSKQERVKTADRDFARCIRRGAHVQTEGGRVISTCRSDFPDNWLVTAQDLNAAGYTNLDGSAIFPVDSGLPIYTPGSSNLLDPNGNPVMGFSTFSALPDQTQDSLRGFPNPIRPFALDRFRYIDSLYNDQFDRRKADLWRPFERYSLVLNGHIDPGWGNNTEIYFEGFYFNRQNDVIGANEQIFPTVLGQAPLVDSSNNYVLDANGAIQYVDNPMNPFPFDVSPILTLDDIPQTFDTELQQSRFVVGMTGDITGSWTFDMSASYDRATGFVKQPVLLENNLFFATQGIGVVANRWGNPSDQVTCGARLAGFDLNGQFTLPDCVVADFLNPSVVDVPGVSSGRFSSQAERDYLVQNRTNRTVTEMTQVMAWVTGDIFEIPGGGMVAAAIGAEWREDKIDSQNSALGVLGLNAAENPLQEGETRGERTTIDWYAEISAPVIEGREFIDLLQLDLAARHTDDENFGKETVYKAGGLWRVNEYLSASASFNTSFRAPNLREQFLADQAGALPGGVDPCRQPTFDLIPPGPSKDRLRTNCELSGADVTQLGSSFTVAIPTSVGGAAGLDPETSESITATISATQPWFDQFDLDVAVTYFDIEIEDTVRSLDPGTIVARCFFDQPNLGSPFCERVERNRPGSPASLNFISFVRAGFVNTGEETTKGWDLTTRFNMVAGPTLINWTTGTTILDERLSQEFPPSAEDPDGSAIVDNVGRIGNPEITFSSTLGVTWGNFDFIWQARWWDDTRFAEGVPNPVITDVNGLLPNGMAPGDVYEEFTDYGFFNSSQFDTDTVGPLRPVVDAEGQWHHDVSVTYNLETDMGQYSFTVGANNITDEEPPLIDQSAGPNRNNAVTSARYDQVGRSYFVRVHAKF